MIGDDSASDRFRTMGQRKIQGLCIDMQEEVKVMKSISRACIASSIVGMAYVMYSLCIGTEVIDSAFVSLCLVVFGVCLMEE